MSIVLPSVAALSKTIHQFTVMEVADQWRREWAGTAEYGKVTEGGVTRRVARAMEVLHASGPGSRVRVMRAAYHSSAGPGAPAESFMLHSSRRVISSGFNFLEPPSLSTKPLEISSTPLELIHDSNGETENYKVTEPDDLEISEPSKWRGSTRESSIRMPSEESSSTDNASIIDLDARSSRHLHRKYSFDSESSDIQFRSRSNSRNSHLLDAPTALSTLKYKSLLNNSNEWNTRRKSYSFEDTCPINETIIHSNDTLAMESSTDSGICKSTEVMNEHLDDNSHVKYFAEADKKAEYKEGSFREWLSKNRQNSQYRGTKFKTYREHPIVIEDSKENNIVLKSPGKVSITLPVTIETDNDNNPRKFQLTDDERRVKKVEFCKTELHFAAESGKVKIIATDDKPPPSNDFRKRRSAFVPIHDMVDRPITLFGEKPHFSITDGIETKLNITNEDFNESDENTAATKSILKNKIPKPKPYLLGENMDFGISDDAFNKTTNNSVLTAVSLVNQQLESEKRYKNEIETTFSKEAERNVINNHVFRTINAGPVQSDNLKHEKHVVTNVKIEKPKVITGDVKNKLHSLETSPVPVKPKTRQLRESDLTYFGIDDRKTKQKEQFKQFENKFKRDNVSDDIFQSVKLIQQVSSSVSNSVCNSEPESEDAPEYQNIPLNINFAPVPTPRLRSKYDEKCNEVNQVRARLKPITEKESDEAKDSLKLISRRAKLRRHEEVKPSRSHSEPPKNFRLNSTVNNRRAEKPSSCDKFHPIESLKKDFIKLHTNDLISLSEDTPIYVNLNTEIDKLTPDIEKNNKISVTSRQRQTHKTSNTKNKREKVLEAPTPDYDNSQRLKDRSVSSADNGQQKKHAFNKDTLSNSLKREATSTRAVKTNTSQHHKDTQRTRNDEVKTKDAKKNRESKHKIEDSHIIEKRHNKEHNSRSLQKPLPKSISDEPESGGRDRSTTNRDTSSHRKRNSSKEKTNSLRENIKPSSKVDSNHSPLSTTPTKSNEKELGSKPSSHRSNKHREYVINYDDKNGTVSSICKIKPGQGTPRRKKTSKDILKENNKNNDLKIKSLDKIALRK